MAAAPLSLEEVAEEYRFLRAAGETQARIAERLGFTDRSYFRRRLQQARRHGFEVDAPYEFAAAPPREVMAAAACAGHDPDDWFPEPEHLPTPASERARAVCRTCPVQPECLQWAVQPAASGIWGGLATYERRSLRETPAPARGRQGRAA